MQVRLDAAGNLKGLYRGQAGSAKRLIIGSHLDTVPNGGAYDGVLGVVLGIALVEALNGERLPFAIEIIGFSEEEGVRFGFPFIGSRAVAGTLDDVMLERTDCDGISVRKAIERFGLDPAGLAEAAAIADSGAYLEFHIEQGPVLDNLRLPLGVVTAIAGQSRALVTFSGEANHAGTTPMFLRKDGLCAAAEWILQVEQEARAHEGLVATVGRMEVKPGATNVVPGEVTATLDVRHASDWSRSSSFDKLLASASAIAQRRGIPFVHRVLMNQPAVRMDGEMTERAAQALQAAGLTAHRMASGAGHDAMVVAPIVPSAMIFLRSPNGISHHPDELVLGEDVAVALKAGFQLLNNLKSCRYLN